MTHLRLIVFWFKWRSFIFIFDNSFFILPQITYFNTLIIHLMWYFRIMISVFMSTRRGKSNNRSILQLYATVSTKSDSFNIFSGCSWPNKKQVSKLKKCHTLIMLTINFEFLLIEKWTVRKANLVYWEK